MIWFALNFRCERFFKRMNKRPLFAVPPPPPMDDMKPSTFGSAATIFIAASWCSRIASNEMSCDASVVAMREPDHSGTARKICAGAGHERLYAIPPAHPRRRYAEQGALSIQLAGHRREGAFSLGADPDGQAETAARFSGRDERFANRRPAGQCGD